jgi:glycosyltransferase involved in cell wall biosynthesis
MTGSRPVIHLINPLMNAFGGSERRTLGVYDLLSPHADVTLWSGETPDVRLPAGYDVRRIDVAAGAWPQGGHMVFVGCYQAIRDWVLRARSDRTILIYNTPGLHQLLPAVQKLSALGSPVEIVYAAEWMKKIARCIGVVHPSPIDLQRFAPGPERSQKQPFTIGRLSRDIAIKHHEADADLYRGLAADGMRVRVMGGTLLQPVLGDAPGIDLTPAGSTPAETFLQGLDCFYYRTNDKWIEPSGRVVLEAMASGVPVVAHRRGGYAEFIRHGHDGFLFNDQSQAVELIKRLRDDASLRTEISTAARATALRVCGPEAMEQAARYYLLPGRKRLRSAADGALKQPAASIDHA